MNLININNFLNPFGFFASWDLESGYIITKKNGHEVILQSKKPFTIKRLKLELKLK